MPTPLPRPTPERPTVDEWGMYDPERAGLAALYTRLSSTPRAAADQPATADAAKPALPLPKTPADR